MDYGSCSSNPLMSLYISETTKSRIREKIKLKIQAKVKLIGNSLTLENPCKGVRYLKLECLQFDFLIKLGQPTDSIVIHTVLCLNWQPVVRFYGAHYSNSHIIHCGINKNNKTSLLVQSIAVKKGLVIAETTISVMEMTFRNAHFNKVTFLCVFLELKKMIAEPTISLMEMTFAIVHLVVSAPI